MKKNLFITLLLLSITILNSCKKNSDTLPQEETGDTLPEQENLFLDTISVSNPNLNDIIGVNGNVLARLSTTAKLLDGLLNQAQSLSGQKIILHPEEGPLSPRHYGIAYSYGQRDFTTRKNPPFGNALHKKYAVFGTDCSGLMINLLKSQGVNISNTNVAGFESALKTAIQSNSTHNQINVTNMGRLPFNKIESGDFIKWTSHIGIVAVLRNGNKIVYQSNGTGEPADSLAQAKNIGLQRGVHPIDLSKAINGAGFWGNGYSIIRLKSGIEIGDTLAGGVVFYIDSTGNHGYVCSKIDLSTSANWTSAFSICSNYNAGGFTDWILPNNYLLNLMYIHQVTLGGFNSGCNNSNFGQCSYWSSEPNGPTYAWCQYFTTGTLWSNYDRIGLARVRAVRKF
jgi:hypothetical protein